LEEVERPAGLAVNQQRAVVLAAPDREVIDPEDPRAGRFRSGAAMTSRSMTCRLAGAPSPAASRDPARPASGTAMLPSTPASSGVFRA